MTKTQLDEYFSLLDSGARAAEEIADLFTDNATVVYVGDTARGRSWIAHVHHLALARFERTEHEWTVVEETPKRLTARWSAKGVLVGGKEYLGFGHAAADLADDGRIAFLRVGLEPGGTEPERAAISGHLEAWAVADRDERHRLMADVYHRDIRFIEMDEAFHGHAELSDHIEKVLEPSPPSLVRTIDVIRNHDYVQYEWTLVHPVAGEAHGWEVLHLDGDLLDVIVLFSKDMTVVDGVH